MQTTYESIEPLIVKTTLNGDYLTCEFSGSTSHAVLESTVSVSGFVGAKSRMKTSFIREIKYTVASFVSNFLRQFLGQWVGDSLARVSDQGLRPNYADVNLAVDDKRKAIISAFEKISDKFSYDPASKKYKPN